jgi:hypothetical protein
MSALPNAESRHSAFCAAAEAYAVSRRRPRGPAAELAELFAETAKAREAGQPDEAAEHRLRALADGFEVGPVGHRGLFRAYPVPRTKKRRLDT